MQEQLAAVLYNLSPEALILLQQAILEGYEMSKYNRIVSQLTCQPNYQTRKTVLDQVPSDVYRECPARLVAQVANAIHAAYQSGRQSTGAEVINNNPHDGLVWVNCINQAVSFKLTSSH